MRKNFEHNKLRMLGKKKLTTKTKIMGHLLQLAFGQEAINYRLKVRQSQMTTPVRKRLTMRRKAPCQRNKGQTK
jgi:hypothetical protein